MFDHDFSHLAEGVAIPHAIFDLQNNSAYMLFTGSDERHEVFACRQARR